MPVYKAPVDEVTFLLHDVFRLDRYNNLPGFAEATPDVVEAVLAEAAKFSEAILMPLNRVGDKEGCRRNADGSVTTPSGFKDAYKKLAEGGWIGVSAPAEFGGQGLPIVINQAVSEFFSSANMAFGMYAALTEGAAAAITVHGSPEQKNLYLPKLVSGQWAGTMTRAAPQSDGSYNITGTKIFISAGEHDLAENIVHLVLARIDGAPAGTRGLSLFIVPKFLPAPNGGVGARNAVSCGSIEEKMGIHGNATCVMNYDGAIGWLVAEPNRGLQAMFTMMNEARLGVGVQGLAMSEVAYQNAAAYARERLAGRALTGAKFPDKAADPIIVHPDVRRMLMSMRAFNEAARALVVWTALKSDIAHRAADTREKQAAEDHLALLTPVIKGVLTDGGFANAVLAQQIYGGHGYIAEHGIEQFVRDARITMLYEGTNGVQALDLVGRKLPKDGGRALQAFFAELTAYAKERGTDPAMAPYIKPVSQALGDLQQATMWFLQNALGNPDNAGAGATDYMHLIGLVALGYMWCLIAEAAKAKTGAGGDGATDRMAQRLATGRFFMERMLPATATHLARIKAGAMSTMALPAEAF
jgi:alkylation response protein AidB-like acyl-CoA dehydrogenase